MVGSHWGREKFFMFPSSFGCAWRQLLHMTYLLWCTIPSGSFYNIFILFTYQKKLELELLPERLTQGGNRTSIWWVLAAMCVRKPLGIWLSLGPKLTNELAIQTHFIYMVFNVLKDFQGGCIVASRWGIRKYPWGLSLTLLIHIAFRL